MTSQSATLVNALIFDAKMYTLQNILKSHSVQCILFKPGVRIMCFAHSSNNLKRC